MTSNSDDSEQKPTPLEAAPVPRQQPLTRIQLDEHTSRPDGRAVLGFQVERPKKSDNDKK